MSIEHDEQINDAMKIRLAFFFSSMLFVLNSCCIGAKEDYLGNNIYLSEYDNTDRRILYQKESCSSSGIEIVPATILEMSYNSEWIIAKSGSRKNGSNFKYWVIKNKYENLPSPEIVKKNTLEFVDYNVFKYYLTNKDIGLQLKRID